ncbi:MAG: zeta toxin family protein [Saprospiraceae bacterium]
MRIFAGPNGSGKSTIYEIVNSKFDVGIYINPDEVQKTLDETHEIDLSSFGVSSPYIFSFSKFITQSSLKKKSSRAGYSIDLISDKSKIISLSNQHAYEASLLCEFIRENLIRQGKSFTFETVMSHKSKIEIMEYARSNGYKNYLYFIATDSPEINIERVRERVQKGGHPVDTQKINDRYFKSLKLLKSAIALSYSLLFSTILRKKLN